MQQIYDPTSPKYHHFLNNDQINEQFCPNIDDYQNLINFVMANGLKVTNTYPNRLVLDVSGKVSDIEKIFHIKMLLFNHPTEKRTFYAPDKEPVLDLNTSISHISGLDNYSLPHPLYKILSKGHNNIMKPATGTGFYHNYMGSDFRTAYVPGVTLDGTGQEVGLLEFDGYNASDITHYENSANLPNVPLQNVLVDSSNGQNIGDDNDIEVDLDIEMAISMAPKLSKVVVFEAPIKNYPWDDILEEMEAYTDILQFSSSWGLPGKGIDGTADNLFLLMQLHGQSFFQASGDLDAYTGEIPFPCDNPNITIVGGTSLSTNGAGGTWKSETVWNVGYVPDRKAYMGSGGGVSTNYRLPSWQNGLSEIDNYISSTHRNIPDVALTADSVYVYCDNLDMNIMGTSCAAPLWAGFIALVNQQLSQNYADPVGFINPAIYSIGNSSNYSSNFHDVTVGADTTPFTGIKFLATSGYGLCTGWGTPNGQNLINSLTENLIWSGNIDITSNYTVPNGQTLTILSGTIVQFSNGASLIVNGTLNAQGSSTNKITFDFVSPNQNGIKVNQGSTVTFNHVIIKNAYQGIYLNRNYASVQNTQFSNCSSGMYLYNTNYAVTEPLIKNNTFTGTGTGIFCYYSSPNIVGNEISNSGTGIYCSSFSSPNLGYSNVYGNNNIHNNTDGLFVIVYSNPFLGRDACEAYGGYNSIYSNGTYNLKADIVCNIIAEKNWWGANPPDANKIVADDGSTVDYNPWLPSNPLSKIVVISSSPEETEFNKAFATVNNSMGVTTVNGNNDVLISSDTSNTLPNLMYNYSKDWPIKWKLLFARRLTEIGKYPAAIYACKDVILNYPDSTLSCYALDLLWHAYNGAKDTESFKSFLKDIISTNKLKPIAGQANLILAGYIGNSEPLELENIQSTYRDTNVVQAAYFREFMYYLNEDFNKLKASAVLANMNKLFPNSILTQNAQDQLEYKNQLNDLSKGEQANLPRTGEIPKNYALLGNYPNPFNPTTNIVYNLPRNSEVEITIFDVLGNKVRSFKISSQSAGRQELTWDSRDANGNTVASGTYLYHFTAHSLEGKNEVFEKSGKLLLLK